MNNKMKINCKKSGFVAILTAFVILAVSLALVLPGTVRAAEINEINPELTFVNVDGKLGESAKYTPSGTGYQYGDSSGEITEKGNYRIDTKSYVAWWESDDFTFGYKKIGLGTSSSDELNVETTVTDRYASDGVSIPYETASGGIMIRDGLNGDEAMAFLHVRGNEIMMVYRSKQGISASAVYTGIVPRYPVSLKMVKKGNMITGYFKNAGETRFSPLKSIGAKIGEQVYVGIGAHSSVLDIPLTCKFSGLTYTGHSTVDTTDDNSGSSSSEQVEPYEDPPVVEGTLLRETFADLSLTNVPEAIDNPIWNEPSCTNIVVLEDGNRVLNKNFKEGDDFIGSREWTDYYASVDLQYTENFDEALTNISTFYVRMRWNETLGYYGYGIQVKNGNTLVLRRYCRSTLTSGTVINSVEIPSIYGDGKFHNIGVKCFDNIITVYFDGEEKMNYVDNNTIYNTMGCVGIGSQYCDVNFDNITVTAIDDPLGGSYDNAVGGIGLDADGNADYNQPVPSYIKNWSDSGNTFN